MLAQYPFTKEWSPLPSRPGQIPSLQTCTHDRCRPLAACTHMSAVRHLPYRPQDRSRGRFATISGTKPCITQLTQRKTEEAAPQRMGTTSGHSATLWACLFSWSQLFAQHSHNGSMPLDAAHGLSAVSSLLRTSHRCNRAFQFPSHRPRPQGPERSRQGVRLRCWHLNTVTALLQA